MSELTQKQRAFIEALPVNQWNGTQAAIAAGYSTKSAHVMASRLLDNPNIAEELERRRAEIAEKTDVEVAEIVTALRQFAFGGKKATNTEQLRALELLGKYRAMFTDRQVSEGNVNFTVADIFAVVQGRRAVQSREVSLSENTEKHAFSGADKGAGAGVFGTPDL